MAIGCECRLQVYTQCVSVVCVCERRLCMCVSFQLLLLTYSCHRSSKLHFEFEQKIGEKPGNIPYGKRFQIKKPGKGDYGGDYDGDYRGDYDGD